MSTIAVEAFTSVRRLQWTNVYDWFTNQIPKLSLTALDKLDIILSKQMSKDVNQLDRAGANADARYETVRCRMAHCEAVQRMVIDRLSQNGIYRDSELNPHV